MIDWAQATPWDGLDLKAVSQACQGCQACELARTRQQVVVGEGQSPCSLMVIGEAPGEQEDETGRPFVGKAGQLLDKIFESVGIHRAQDCYITNVVKCRPPKNRNPHPDEALACRGFLIRQIQLVQPRVLVLLGSVAFKSVLHDDTPIGKCRGKWRTMSVSYMPEPLYVMPMFHPSYLLRNQSRDVGSPKWLTWQDIKEVQTALAYYRASLPASP